MPRDGVDVAGVANLQSRSGVAEPQAPFLGLKTVAKDAAGRGIRPPGAGFARHDPPGARVVHAPDHRRVVVAPRGEVVPVRVGRHRPDGRQVVPVGVEAAPELDAPEAHRPVSAPWAAEGARRKAEVAS